MVFKPKKEICFSKGFSMHHWLVANAVLAVVFRFAAVYAGRKLEKKEEKTPENPKIKYLVKKIMGGFWVVWLSQAIVILVPREWPKIIKPMEDLMPETIQGVACVCLVAGLLLYILSITLLIKNIEDDLIEKGPYKLIRHPAYTAAILIITGSFLVLPTPLMAVAVPVAVVLMILEGFAEDRELEKEQGEAFRDYRSRTKRFIPFIF